MTVGPPYWVEVLTKGGREIIWTTLPDKQVGYFCLPGLIPVGRYIPITPDAGPRAPRPDEVERHVLLLDDEGLVERRLDHLHQLGVVKVVDDVLEDVPGRIRKYAK